MKKQHLGLVVAILAVLAAAGFVAWKWQHGDFSWQGFVQSLAGVNWWWLSLSWFIGMLTYYGRAVRWEVMVRPLNPNASVWRLFSATIIGFSAIAVFGRAGEPVRPMLIAKSEGVSVSSQFAAWILERILDLQMVLVIFGLALIGMSSTALHPGPRMRTVLDAAGYTAGVAGVASLLLLIAMRQFRGRVRERLTEGLAFLPEKAREKIGGIFAQFEEGMQCMRSSWTAFLIVVYSAVQWMLIGLCFWALFRAFPATQPLGATEVMILVGFVAFGSLLQIPGVGGGMQIVTALVLTEFFHVSLEAASGIALVLWVVTFVGVVPFGFLFAFREGISWSSLRQSSKIS